MEKYTSKAITGLQSLLVEKEADLVTLFSISFEKKLIDLITKSDVVHIHSAYNLIKIEKLPNFLNIQSMFYTLHDLRFLTGGCHYPGKCDGYKSKCNKCPLVRSGFQSNIMKNLALERDVLRNSNRNYFISPSKWIESEFRKIPDFKNSSIKVIPNIVNTNSVATQILSLREKMQVSEKEFIVAFIAANVTYPLKGFNDFISAIIDLRQNFGSRRIRSISIGLGNTNSFTFPEGHLHLGGVSSDEIKEIMKEINLLVVPSLEENYPNVIIEALLAGTRVIGSDVGGIPEILDNFGMSSFKPRDIKTISKLIWEELLSVKSDRSSISIKASNIYDSSKIAKNTIAYYESTLTNG